MALWSAPPSMKPSLLTPSDEKSCASSLCRGRFTTTRMPLSGPAVMLASNTSPYVPDPSRLLKSIDTCSASSACKEANHQ
eukprot:2639658-Rhodomonas_salina.2